MNAELLRAYLSPAHIQVMLCRAHADNFALSREEILDAEFQIGLHIADLETLRADIHTRIAPSMIANEAVQSAYIG